MRGRCMYLFESIFDVKFLCNIHSKYGIINNKII
jgi:hypothetical protein